MREAFKYLAVLLVVTAASVGFVQLHEGKGYGLKTGQPAPGFRLPTLSGGEVDLAGLRGKILVVNYWATSCPPCVEEMPSLERLHQALAPEGLVVLGVSADEDEAALRQFVEKHAIRFPVLRDPGGRAFGQAYRTTGYPETFVVDRAGTLIESYVGPAEWDTPGAIDHFRRLLKSLSTAPTR